MDVWIRDGCMDERWMDVWIRDGCMDEGMDVWMKGWMYG